MGRINIKAGNALNEGNKTRVQIPPGMKVRSLEVTLTGDPQSDVPGTLNIADLKLNRMLPGSTSRDTVQEADLADAYRMAQSIRAGETNSQFSSGSAISLTAKLDQFAPLLPNNVMHVMGSDEAVLVIDWGGIDQMTSLSFSVDAVVNQASVEQYIRRVDEADLDLTDGGTKKRETGENCHRIYARPASSGDVADDGISLSEWVGGNETIHYEDQSPAEIRRQIEEGNTTFPAGISYAPGSGTSNWHFLQVAESAQRSEHVNDYLHYEIEGGADGRYVAYHDRVDFANAYNERSARLTAERQAPRISRDPVPDTAQQIEAAMQAQR